MSDVRVIGRDIVWRCCERASMGSAKAYYSAQKDAYLVDCSACGEKEYVSAMELVWDGQFLRTFKLPNNPNHLPPNPKNQDEVSPQAGDKG